MTQAPLIAVRKFVARDTDHGTLLAQTCVGSLVQQSFLRGAVMDDIPRFPWDDRGTQRTIPIGDAETRDAPETAAFNGCNVLLALRTTEPCDALWPWLTWHIALGYDAVLIVDGPGDLDEATLASCPDARALKSLFAVSATAPLLTSGDAPTLGEPIIIEAIRHRFLSEASRVTCIALSDLMLPDQPKLDGYTVLGGQTVFPWRLRKGKPAPFHDHIYRSQGDTADRSAWSVAPASFPAHTLWVPGHLAEAKPDAIHTEAFVHAIGVARPGVDPKELVDKTALSEHTKLAALMERVYGRPPLRRRESPASVPVGEGVTLVTAMKNEGPFILDWLAHHRAVGVDRFVVFTNDCEDGTDALLDALARASIVEHHPNPYRKTGKVPQRAAFDAAAKLDSVLGAGWLMTLDVDEYLNIHAGVGHIDDLRGAAPEANVFSIPWRLFGSDDRTAFVDEPVTRQFTACAPAFCSRPHQAWGFKTLYQNAGFFRRLGVHRPLGLVPDRVAAMRWVNGSGKPLPQRQWRKAWRMTAETWGYDLASINHYAVRSAESYLVKRDRGRVNHTSRDQSSAYWFRMNQNADRDTSIRRMDERVAKERAALVALPDVARLHAAAVAWHQAKIAELKADPDHRAVFEEITGDRLRRLSRMPGRFGSNVYLAGPDAVPDDILARSLDEDWVFTIPRADRKD